MRDITEKVSGITEHKTPRAWYIAIAVTGSITGVLGLMLAYLAFTGIGVWGNNSAGRLGLGHHEFRLLDRYRPRRYADLGDSVSVPAEVANLHQPLRRGDDAFAVACAGIYPLLPRRPSVARLLALPDSEHRLEHVAEFPQPAAVGRVRGQHLRHGVGAVLVCRPGSRSRHAARSRHQQVPPHDLRNPQPGLARIGEALEALRDGLPDTGRPLDAAGLSVHTIVSFDFAVSVIPGWHTTIFPPYFVAGAIFSGFAMVMTLMVIARRCCNLEDLITMKHLENMCKVILATGMHRRLRLQRRSSSRLVQRQSVRALHLPESRDSARMLGVLDDDHLQRICAAVVLVQEDPHERRGHVLHLDLRQHRHVV